MAEIFCLAHQAASWFSSKYSSLISLQSSGTKFFLELILDLSWAELSVCVMTGWRNCNGKVSIGPKFFFFCLYYTPFDHFWCKEMGLLTSMLIRWCASSISLWSDVKPLFWQVSKSLFSLPKLLLLLFIFNTFPLYLVDTLIFTGTCNQYFSTR